MATDWGELPPPEGLSERDIQVARYASKLAVQEMEKTFYARVGKSVITRWLVILGAIVVGFGAGRDWLK